MVALEQAVADIKAPADRRLLEAMLSRAEMLLHNLAPGALERPDLGRVALAFRNPRLITCTRQVALSRVTRRSGALPASAGQGCRPRHRDESDPGARRGYRLGARRVHRGSGVRRYGCHCRLPAAFAPQATTAAMSDRADMAESAASAAMIWNNAGLSTATATLTRWAEP